MTTSSSASSWTGEGAAASQFENFLDSLCNPPPSEVREPRRQLDRGIGERLNAALFEQAFEGGRIVPPAPRVPHHHFKECRPLGPGLEGAEGGSLGQLDMGASGASPVTAEDLAVEDHDDVRAEVTVSPLNDSGIPPRVQRQIERISREGQPLLPDRGDGAVRQSHSAHLLPRDIEIIEVAEAWFELGHLRPIGVLHG